MYFVLICYNCGQLLLAKTGQKTKRCPYCDARLALEKARKVGTASDAYQALNLVQALKTKKSSAWTQA